MALVRGTFQVRDEARSTKFSTKLQLDLQIKSAGCDDKLPHPGQRHAILCLGFRDTITFPRLVLVALVVARIGAITIHWASVEPTASTVPRLVVQSIADGGLAILATPGTCDVTVRSVGIRGKVGPLHTVPTAWATFATMATTTSTTSAFRSNGQKQMRQLHQELHRCDLHSLSLSGDLC